MKILILIHIWNYAYNNENYLKVWIYNENQFSKTFIIERNKEAKTYRYLILILKNLIGMTHKLINRYTFIMHKIKN